MNAGWTVPITSLYSLGSSYRMDSVEERWIVPITSLYSLGSSYRVDSRGTLDCTNHFSIFFGE